MKPFICFQHSLASAFDSNDDLKSMRMKLHRRTQVTCWEILESGQKWKACCSLTWRISQTLAKGIIRESGWTVADIAREISLASGIKFHRSNRITFSLPVSFPRPPPDFIFIPLSWWALAKTQMLTGSLAISQSLSFASRLAILLRNFVCFILFSTRCDVTAFVWRNFIRAREKSPLCVQARFKRQRKATPSFLLPEHTLCPCKVDNYFNCYRLKRDLRGCVIQYPNPRNRQAVTDSTTAPQRYLGLIQSVLNVSVNFARTETHTRRRKPSASQIKLIKRPQCPRPLKGRFTRVD